MVVDPPEFPRLDPDFFEEAFAVIVMLSKDKVVAFSKHHGVWCGPLRPCV